MKLLTEQKIYFTLRIASAICFIGHGAFGIITKPVWVNYFGVFDISNDHAWQLMPWVGTVDILLGLALLFYPVRAVFVWLVIWGTITALLRPLSGEPFAEFIERAGNFGAPLAFLIFSGVKVNSLSKLFAPVNSNIKLDQKTLNRLIVCLRIVAFLLILGHGWLNLIEKETFVNIYRFFGFVNPASAAQAIGLLEILAAFAILIRPFRSMVLVVFFWKVASELFYPHYGFFEWIERGGSYGSLLALWFSLDLVPESKRTNAYSILNLFLLKGSRASVRKSLSNHKRDYAK
ncbi:MAG: hypothetical protein ABI691_02650 [Ginsengibacter sp.]